MIQIRKRKNNAKKDGSAGVSWRVEYKDAAGKRKQSQFKTRAGAEAKRDEIMRAFGGPEARPAYTFAEAAESYLKICEKIGRDGNPPVEVETVDLYKACLVNHVLPQIGGLDVANLTAPEVVAFRDWLIVESGKGPETCRLAFIHYKGVLQEAFNRGKIANHVWAGIKVTQKKKAEPATQFDEDFGDAPAKIPSKTQAAHLLQVASALRDDPRILMGWDPANAAARPWQKYSPSTGPRGWRDVRSAWRKYYVLILLAITTGLRQGEIRALKWDSLKLDKNLLYVRHAASGTGRIKSPKSSAGYRVLDLPEQVVAELEAWRAFCPKGDLVFPSGTGRVESKSNIYKRCWLTLLKYAELDQAFVFHSLRHYFASTLIAQNFNAKEVQSEMGHADIQTTFNIYGHLFPEDRAMRAAKKQAAAAELLALAERPDTKIVSLVHKRYEKNLTD